MPANAADWREYLAVAGSRHSLRGPQGCRLLAVPQRWNRYPRGGFKMKSPAITAVFAGVLGFAFGTMMNEPHPRTALAQSAASSRRSRRRLPTTASCGSSFLARTRTTRVSRRRRRDEVGEARSSCEARVGNQRRHRPLADGGRPAGAAAKERSDGGGAAAGRHHRSAGHPRWRDSADAGEPAHDHAVDSPMERGHRDHQSAQRLSSRPPLHIDSGAGLGVHGGGSVLHARTCRR